MTKQVQRRRGTATQHTSFTGADGETSVNTTNKSIHVHDGSTVGGFEAARIDLTNVTGATVAGKVTGSTLSSLTITSADINGGTIDSTAIGNTTPSSGIFTTLSASSTLTLGGTAVTSTAAELNILDGVTSTAAELNILDGVTATTAELNFVDGVTSNVQTQLNTKAPLASPTFTGTVVATSLDISGDIDVDGTTNLDVVDIDGAVDMASTLGVTGAITGTTASFTRLDINASNTKLKGDLFAYTDASYDIGASGANRPRNLYLSSSITAGDITTTGAGVASFASGAVFNENSYDSDFRVESDTNANALFVQGTSSPSTTLDLVGSWVSNTGVLSIDTPSGETYSGLGILNNGAIKGFLYHDNSAGALDLQTYTTDALRFKTNNTERMRIDSSGGLITNPAAGGHAVFNENSVDADFRVESDANAHALFVDGGANVIGMGTSIPSTYVGGGGLSVKGSTNSDLALVSSSVSAGDNSHQLRFYNEAGASYEIARMRVNVGAGQVNRGEIQFSNNNGATLRPWLDVDYGNNVVFNQQGYDADFRVASDTNDNAFVVDAGTSIVRIGAGSDVANNSQPKLSVTTPWKASSSTDYDGTLSLVATGGGASGGRGPQIIFTGEDGSSARTLAKIDAIKENSTSGDYAGALIFRTRKNASDLPARLHLLSYAAIFNDDSDDTDFIVESDGNANMLFVDASTNRVGVGLNAPTRTLHVADSAADPYVLVDGSAGNRDSGFSINAGGGEKIAIRGDAAGSLYYGHANEMLFTTAGAIFNEGGADLDFRVESDANANALIVDAGGSGSIGFGGTDVFSYGQTSGNGVMGYIIDNGSSYGSLTLSNNADRGWSPIYINKFAYTSGDDKRFIQWSVNGGSLCNIELNDAGTAVVYQTTSDRRLKENIQDLTGGIETVKKLRPRSFEWVTSEDNTFPSQGFIADEADGIIPEIVSGEANAVYEDGKPSYQSMEYSKLVPILTAALKESITKIEDLEARITALENA
jgi:hypothetical protein